ASANVLTALFGPDYGFAVGSDGLPGITRSFSSFAAAAAEAGESRIYGGIHFQFDNQIGLATGGPLGQFVVQNFLIPVPQEETQIDSQAQLLSDGLPGQFAAQNLPVPVPMGAVAFLVTGPTNGSPVSGVIPGTQQTMTAKLPVSVLASPNSAWTIGHPVVTETQPGHLSHPGPLEAADVFGHDMAVIWRY